MHSLTYQPSVLLAFYYHFRHLQTVYGIFNILIYLQTMLKLI